MSRYLIYALVDPRTGQWRYIGKSCRALERPTEHTRPSYLKARTMKNAWVKSLLARGQTYAVEVLEEFESAGELNEAECEWIAEARRVGMNLTNGTDGGDGAAGATWSWSEESRARARKAKLGVPSNMKGRRHSRASVLKMSRSRGGRKFVDDLGRTYQTLADAAEINGVNIFNISAVLHGRRARAGGREFRYAENI